MRSVIAINAAARQGIIAARVPPDEMLLEALPTAAGPRCISTHHSVRFAVHPPHRAQFTMAETCQPGFPTCGAPPGSSRPFQVSAWRIGRALRR
jgi:hypothetical protein